ncbi:MAG: ADP-ribosylglycohydrolase family protein, partial [Eubacteriales bacterium]
HYLFNDHADDIDWQIECDFLGMMYPGLINEAAARAFELGHITNYGDGVYGGVFIATMHAAAYTASSVEEIVYTGLSVIPDDTTFKECLNEVIKGYEEGKTWEEVWQTLQAKYGDGDRCIEMTEGTKLEAYNIDAKLNSAYTAIGLLWGEGDFEKTTTIACRCGQDSDCNASSAASVLGNFIGAENIPEKYKIGLDRNGTVFSNTKYTFDDAFDANYELMMAVLEDSENVSIKGADYSIDFYEVQTVPYEQWPTTFYVKPVIKAAGNKAVRCSFEARYGEIASAKMDMGDGFSADEVIAYYVYDEAGEYTVKCTFTSTDGEIFEFEQKIIISNEFTVTSKPICSMTPNGSGGNSNLAILVDGVKPAVGANAQKSQFDTYNKNQKPTQPIYIGVEFDVSATVAGIEFTEGMHFNDGGWFESTPAVEVLVDGKWTEVKATVSPDYPEGSTKDAHGDSFETYTFTLETPVENCKGIRISGVAGGSARFISAAELKPIVTAVSGDSSNLRSIIICNETNPQGGGNKSLGVIADGVTAAASSSQQYDTYAGETPEREIFVGYLFKNTQKISKVIYSEGMHFKDGGWFADDIIVEAKIDGKWVEVDASVSPVYLKGSDKAQAQGKTYTFTLKAPVDCSGIRIVGIAGGTAGFISISELDFQ